VCINSPEKLYWLAVGVNRLAHDLLPRPGSRGLVASHLSMVDCFQRWDLPIMMSGGGVNPAARALDQVRGLIANHRQTCLVTRSPAGEPLSEVRFWAGFGA